MRVTFDYQVVRSFDCGACHVELTLALDLTGTWVKPERATRDEPGSGGYVEDVRATCGGEPVELEPDEERVIVQAWEEDLNDGIGIEEPDYDADDDR